MPPPSPSAENARPRPGRVLASATGVIFSGVLPSYLVGSLAVKMREDFLFSNAELGLATAICFLLAATIAPWGGAITHRVGIERGIYVATGLVIGACLIAATVADSAAWIVLLMALLGVSAGIATPSASALLARDMRAGTHGTAFGALTSAPQVGAFIAGFALPLVAQPFGWHTAFFGAGLLSLGFALMIPRRDRSGPVEQAPRVKTAGRRRHVVIMAAVGSGLASGSGIGMRYFLVIFAVGAGFGEAEAGLLLGISAFIAIFSRFGIGVLGDRRPGDAFARAAGLMLLCAVGFIGMAIGGKALIVAGTVLAGGLGWGWQAPLSLAVIERNRDAPAQAIGLQMSGFFGGAVAGPLIVGAWAEQGNFTAAWITCAGLAAGAAAVTLGARWLGRDL